MGSSQHHLDKLKVVLSKLCHAGLKVNANINDLLIITTGSFRNHLDKLKVVLCNLHQAGLEVNAKSCSVLADYWSI